MKNNLKTKLTLILIAFSVIATTACGSDDQPNNVDVNKVLPDIYEKFILKNLEEAHEYAEKLDKAAQALCQATVPTPDADKNALKCQIRDFSQPDAPKIDATNLDCIKLYWIELNEYSTKRLKVFNEMPGFDFQKEAYKHLNGTIPTTSLATFSTSVEGLIPLQSVIWDSNTAPADSNAQCMFLKASAADIKTKVEALKTEWEKEANKKAFISAKDPKAGIKALLTSTATVMEQTTKDDFAGPIGISYDDPTQTVTATNTWEGTPSMRSAWLYNQVMLRGPQSAYIGDYKKQQWTDNLQAIIKEKDSALSTKIDTAYKDFSDNLGPFMRAGGRATPPDLKTAMNVANLKDNAIKTVTAAKTLAESYKAAASKF